jgi:hypothetical protein
LIFNDTSAKLNLADSCIPGQSKALPCDFYRQGGPQPSPSDPKLEASRPKCLTEKELSDFSML